LPGTGKWRVIGLVFLLAAISLLCGLKLESLRAQDPVPFIPRNSSHVAGTATWQNGTSHSNSGQAVLHITATVMPTVFAPQAIPKKTRSGDAVVYLPSTQHVTDVTFELHPLPDSARAALKTTTVVSH
jgi:hypothetical protein